MTSTWSPTTSPPPTPAAPTPSASIPAAISTATCRSPTPASPAPPRSGSAQYRNITFATGKGISGSGTAINLTMDSDANADSDGYISSDGGNFSTSGGNITLGGGSGANTAGSGYAYGESTSGTQYGINKWRTLNAGGGNIVMQRPGRQLRQRHQLRHLLHGECNDTDVRRWHNYSLTGVAAPRIVPARITASTWVLAPVLLRNRTDQVHRYGRRRGRRKRHRH